MTSKLLGFFAVIALFLGGQLMALATEAYEISRRCPLPPNSQGAPFPLP
jgi:hypothetical protein